VEHLSWKRINKPREGHLKRAGREADPGTQNPLPPTRLWRELRLEGQDGGAAVGDRVLVGIFQVRDRVTITGRSKGAGFAGVVKRWGFRGGRATHGSMFHRAPGSIGASSYPSRVVKGMRAAGRMGGDRVTVRNLRVERVDAEKNLLVLRGAVPGARGGYLIIRKALGPRRVTVPQVEKPKGKK
jgi:large subunit ribosomal protein L3